MEWKEKSPLTKQALFVSEQTHHDVEVFTPCQKRSSHACYNTMRLRVALFLSRIITKGSVKDIIKKGMLLTETAKKARKLTFYKDKGVWVPSFDSNLLDVFFHDDKCPKVSSIEQLICGEDGENLLKRFDHDSRVVGDIRILGNTLSLEIGQFMFRAGVYEEGGKICAVLRPDDSYAIEQRQEAFETVVELNASEFYGRHLQHCGNCKCCGNKLHDTAGYAQMTCCSGNLHIHCLLCHLRDKREGTEGRFGFQCPLCSEADCVTLVPSSTSLLFGPERAKLSTRNGLHGLINQTSYVPSVRVDLTDNHMSQMNDGDKWEFIDNEISKAEVTISSDKFYYIDHINNGLGKKKNAAWVTYWTERGKYWDNSRSNIGASLIDVRIYLLYLFLVVC